MRSQRFRRWLRAPKGIFALMLAGCTIVAAASVGWGLSLPGLGAAIIVAGVVDAAIVRWRRGTWRIPDGALLTGWLVALVLSPHAPWWIAGATAAIGILAKHVLRVGRANVLNPAAAGLIVSFHLFDSGQSWWGALPEVSAWWILLLVGLGAIMALRLHKETAVLVFFGVWFSCATVAAFVGDPALVVELFRAPDLQAAIFFAAFMLTDPPTSPPRPRDQVVFAAVTALAAFAAFALIGAAYFLLAGVIAGNLWEGWRKLGVQRSRRAVARAG
ncbi:MAG: RnfABCDGE type electron transport complex subunit D [Gemmatimonadetes bacterium]|nr:RnfABCDGE type electron transport complex subunit D [Gemmatimonadota bacterium]